MALSEAEELEMLSLEREKSMAQADPFAASAQSTAPSGPNVTMGQSFFRGAGQGLTAGFQDEASAALEYLMGKGAGLFKNEDEDPYANATYDDLLKLHRKQNADAEEANPGSYLTGNIAGTTLPTLALGGVGAGTTLGRGANVAKSVLAQTLEKTGAQAGINAAYGGLSAIGTGNGNASVGDVLKSGALNAAIPFGIQKGGQLAGAAWNASKPLAKTAFSKIRGISPETLEELIQNPSKISAIEKMGQNTDEALQEYSNHVAPHVQGKMEGALENRLSSIDNEIMRANADAYPVDISPFYAQAEKEISDILPVGRAAKNAVHGVKDVLQDIDNLAAQNPINDPNNFIRRIQGGEEAPGTVNPFAKNNLKEVESVRTTSPSLGGTLKEASTGERLMNPDAAPLQAGRRMGEFDAKPVTEISPGKYLTPTQLNRLRPTLNREAEALYTNQVTGKRLPGAESMEGLANVSRSELDKISPSIRDTNADIGSVLEYRKQFKKFGLNEEDVDPDKLIKLLTTKSNPKSGFRQSIQSFDELNGTNLQNQMKRARAVKELNPENLLNKLGTGYSALPGVLGIAGAPFTGGLSAVAGLGYSALAAPVLTKPIVKSAIKFDKVFNAMKNNPQSLGKYAGILSRSATQGGNDFAVNDYVLQQTDPEYRKLRDSLPEQ